MLRGAPVLQLIPLTCAALLIAGPALADDAGGEGAPVPTVEVTRARDGRVGEAERLAEAAFEAYQQQRHSRAIELYEQAWAAAPSADIAFNIARIYDRALQDPRSALVYYQRCVVAPRVSPQRRLSAEHRIAELEAELATVPPVPSGPPGSELLSYSPLPPEPAAPAPQQSPSVVVPAARPSRTPLPDTATSRWTPREVTALVLGGVGVSAVGMGLGFALSANGERSEWERGCDGNACTSQSAVNAARSAGRKADIATVALASGAGLLGIGAALWFLAPATAESAPRAELRLSPSVHATDVTCTLSGRF